MSRVAMSIEFEDVVALPMSPKVIICRDIKFNTTCRN